MDSEPHPKGFRVLHLDPSDQAHGDSWAGGGGCRALLWDPRAVGTGGRQGGIRGTVPPGVVQPSGSPPRQPPTLLATSSPPLEDSLGSKDQALDGEMRLHKAGFLGWSKPESWQPGGQALCHWEFTVENSWALWDLCWWR